MPPKLPPMAGGMPPSPDAMPLVKAKAKVGINKSKLKIKAAAKAKGKLKAKLPLAKNNLMKRPKKLPPFMNLGAGGGTPPPMLGT